MQAWLDVRICSKCLDLNAGVDLNQRCACNIGYYKIDTLGVTECKKCLNECLNCSNSSTWISCKDEKSYLDDNGKCKCKDPYYEDSFNEEKVCLKCHIFCK